MSFKKNDYYTLVQRACDLVPGFKVPYQQFIERATISQNSKSLIMNYSRCLTQVALHFNRVPHEITIDELNSYLYRLCVHCLYKMPWVVYSKQPFAGPTQVIEYLGRYTHRIAISNHRIKSVGDGKVTFSYKDYRHGGAHKMMTLDGCEFLRRFCLHVLPPGFMKIRHYGILSSRSKPKLKMQQMKMGVCIVKKQKISWQQIAREVMGFDVEQCPCCKTGKMITMLFFKANAPPHFKKENA